VRGQNGLVGSTPRREKREIERDFEKAKGGRQQEKKRGNHPGASFCLE